MTQWFRGQLEGHYVGTKAGRPAVSQYGSASRYKLRIYRALIRDIEVLEHPEGSRPEAVEGEPGELTETPAPAVPPIDLPDDCFYQAQIEDARLFGIRPRSCFEGSVYDVAVSNVEVSHSTKKGNKTYGRITGEIYGRYLLPSEEEVEESALEIESLTRTEPEVAHVSKGPTSEGTSDEPRNTKAATADATDGSEDSDDEGLEPLHPPTPPDDEDAESDQPIRVPLPLLAVLIAAVLGLTSGALAALLWVGALVPILIIRLILAGQFKINNAQRVFSAVIVLTQLACIAIILLDWWTAGCKSVHIVALSGVVVTTVITSVLPSPVPLLCTGAGLGMILYLWFGTVGAQCEEAPPPAVVAPADESPSVGDPGRSRTNDDGSWPRRPSRNN